LRAAAWRQASVQPLPLPIPAAAQTSGDWVLSRGR
jgi:hypothetical protein